MTPERRKTYAEPALLIAGRLSRYAPTTAVSPETATETPNRSPEPGSEAVSLACWAQEAPVRTNTYAEPAKLSRYAPTTAVSPETATEIPKSQQEAVSLACCNQGSTARG